MLDASHYEASDDDAAMAACQLTSAWLHCHQQQLSFVVSPLMCPEWSGS